MTFSFAFFLASVSLWGIAIGYGVPSFIDWSQRKVAEMEADNA